LENNRRDFKEGGGAPDISLILIFYWFEPTIYLNPISKYTDTTKKPGYFVGFTYNVGYVLTFKILKNDLNTVLQGSVA
jgi:hypothetical protein